VNGNEVRDTWFSGSPPRQRRGYDRSEVDELLRRVAAELDAGRPAGPLIENATFRTRTSKNYDIDAIDWFLDQLLVPQDHVEPAGISADPWRDLSDVTQLVRGGASGLVHRDPPGKPTRRETQEYLTEQCDQAWRSFGHLPGTHLWWEQTRILLRELRTTEQQTLASLRGWGPSAGHGGGPWTVSAGGQSFNFRNTPRASPGAADIAARTGRDRGGHFEKPARGLLAEPRVWLRELVDETRIPILYTSGQNFDRRAWFNISFPDGRWLRFLVRGTQRENAVMTAVDRAGNKVVRYRIIGEGRSLRKMLLGWSRPVEITVNPGRELTDELVLVIALSAQWLSKYFDTPVLQG